MESIKKELFCKLCHGTTTYGSSGLDSTEKEVLNSLNLNIDITDTDLICNSCSENLSAAFNFKLMCLETEENISSCIHSAGNLIDIKEIYVKVKDDKKLIDTFEDTKICRLCLQSVTSEFKSVNEIDLDALREYIPEINFVSVHDPILCKICFDSLCNHSTFLKNCLDAKEDGKNTRLRTKQCCVEIEQLNMKSEEFEIKLEENKERNPDDSLLVPKEKKQNVNDMQTKKCKIFYCNQCNYETKRQSDLNRHRTTHNKTPKIRQKKDKVFQCNTCSYKAEYKSMLKVHNATHTKEKPHICGECGFRTARKGNLNTHMKRHVKTETDTKEFSCEFCPFKTKYSKSLKFHRINHEEPTETFQCHICGFVSRHKAILAKHTRTHKGIEAQIYKCDKCPFQTMYKGSLIEHNLQHMKPDEIKLYKCELCYFSSKKKKGIKRHQLMHKDQSQLEIFECATCGYKTIRKSGMRAHVLIHMDVFVKCELCSFTSRHNYRLNYHIRKHHQGKSVESTTSESCSTV